MVIKLYFYNRSRFFSPEDLISITSFVQHFHHYRTLLNMLDIFKQLRHAIANSERHICTRIFAEINRKDFNHTLSIYIEVAGIKIIKVTLDAKNGSPIPLLPNFDCMSNFNGKNKHKSKKREQQNSIKRIIIDHFAPGID